MKVETKRRSEFDVVDDAITYECETKLANHRENNIFYNDHSFKGAKRPT